MKSTLDRIQDWYKINCNNDWEHNYGCSISTLDNPGWTIRIDLRETALEKLDFNKSYQNESNENDWYNIKTNNQVLEIFCGPSNLEQVLKIFLNDIITSFVDKDFKYEIYLPLTGYKYPIWIPASGILISEDTIELTDIPKVDYSKIKVKNVSLIDFEQKDLELLRHNYKIGDKVKTDVENVDNELILTIKNWP